MQKDIFNVLTSISTYAQTTAKKYSRLFHQGTRLHRKWNFAQVEQQFPVLVDGTEKVNHSQIFCLVRSLPLELYSKTVSLLKKNFGIYGENICTYDIHLP